MKLKEFLDMTAAPVYRISIAGNTNTLIGYFSIGLHQMSLSGDRLYIVPEDQQTVKIQDYFDYDIGKMYILHQTMYDLGYTKCNVLSIILNPKKEEYNDDNEDNELISNEDDPYDINSLLAEIERLKKLVQEKTDNYIPPDTLDIEPYKDNDFYLISDGTIMRIPSYPDISEEEMYNMYASKFISHTIYPSKEFIMKVDNKISIITSIMWFKWNFDREFVPKSNDIVYCPYYNNTDNKWDVSSAFKIGDGGIDIYFSTEKLAKKCAEWLNSKEDHQ